MSPLPLLSPPAGRRGSAYDVQRTGSRAALGSSRPPDARPSPPRADGTGAQAALPRRRRPRRPMEMSDYQLAGCRLVTRATSGTQALRRTMTGGNLLSACPRAETGGPAGRTAGLCNPPVDRSPDSRINAERQGLPMPARPRGRRSLAGAKLQRRIRRAEHSDRRPSAPACRPLPAYSGGTVWDSHPLPGIVGSRAVARQYSTSPRCRGTGNDGGRPRPAATGRAPRPGVSRQASPGPATDDATLRCPVVMAASTRRRGPASATDDAPRPTAPLRGAARLRRHPFPPPSSSRLAAPTPAGSPATGTAPPRRGASPPVGR